MEGDSKPSGSSSDPLVSNESSSSSLPSSSSSLSSSSSSEASQRVLSSREIFDSVFAIPSTLFSQTVRKDSSNYQVVGSWRKQQFEQQIRTTKDGSPGDVSKSIEGEGYGESKNNMPFSQQGADSFSLSSSLYYGGQDICSTSPNTHGTGSFVNGGKDGGIYENNSDFASRGNWWQGSLYY